MPVSPKPPSGSFRVPGCTGKPETKPYTLANKATLYLVGSLPSRSWAIRPRASCSSMNWICFLWVISVHSYAYPVYWMFTIHSPLRAMHLVGVLIMVAPGNVPRPQTLLFVWVDVSYLHGFSVARLESSGGTLSIRFSILTLVMSCTTIPESL